jgi:hypothetical protein
MAHNDPDIWRAIERLTVVMERLDSKNVGVETDGLKEFMKKAVGMQPKCTPDWNGLDQAITLHNEQPTPSIPSGRTIQNRKLWIAYYTERIKDMNLDITKINENFDHQYTQGQNEAAEKLKNKS